MNLSKCGTALFIFSFTLGGFFAYILWIGWVLRFSICYLPFIILFFWKSLQKAKYVPLASMFLALFITEAFPSYITLMILFMALYPLFMALNSLAERISALHSSNKNAEVGKEKSNIIKPLIIALAIGMLAFMLSGFRSVTSTYFALENPRLIADTEPGFNFNYFLKALLAHPTTEEDGSTMLYYAESGGYIGYIGLFLSLAGIVISLKDKRLFPLFLLLSFLVVYSFGHNSPLDLWGLLHTLPLFSSQRAPVRAMSFIFFLLTLFSGVGLSRIEKKNKDIANTLLVISVVGFIILNMPRLGPPFWNKPYTEYPKFDYNFHQEGEVGDSMYVSTIKGVGLANYHTSNCPKNNASMINTPEYRGEVYLLGGGSAEVVRFTPNEVEVRVNATAEDILILNQNYYSGWEANSQPAIETNGLVSFDVKSAIRNVTFSYYPPGMTLGLVLTIIGVITSIVIYIKFKNQ